jgi:hypothetical protein
LDLPSALGRLIEYENKLQERWPAEFGGLCQYNESLFSAELVEKMINLHSVIIRGGKIIRRQTQPAQDLEPTRSAFALQDR